jgi:hypothetical protein
MATFSVPFEITPDGGDPYRVVADTRDIYTWEKTTPNKTVTLQQAMEELRFAELYRIAWIAARRQGMFAGTLDDFAATHQVEPKGDDDQEEEEEEGGDAVPTRPVNSPGPSSPSQSSPASRPRSGPKKVAARS